MGKGTLATLRPSVIYRHNLYLKQEFSPHPPNDKTGFMACCMPPIPMLTSLTIENLALFKHLHIQLDTGLTVVTGETGAGKSILVEALHLVLGGRFSRANHFSGPAKTIKIHAEFSLPARTYLSNWMRIKGLGCATKCTITRNFYENGKGRSLINGSKANLSLVKELGKNLVKIAGQHSCQELLSPFFPLSFLDDYCEHQKDLSRLGMLWEKKRALQKQMKVLEGKKEKAALQSGWLHSQITELEQAHVGELDFTNMDEEHRTLFKEKEHREALYALEQSLDDACQQLNKVEHSLRHLTDDGHHAIEELLRISLDRAEDARSELRSSIDRLETDEQKLAELETSLSQFFSLARKYQVEPIRLTSLLGQAKGELQNIKTLEITKKQNKADLLDASKEYVDLASYISKARSAAAHNIEKSIDPILKGLGLHEVFLKFDIKSYIQADRRNGIDEAQIYVQTNPGHPHLLIKKIASGGELARIYLAMYLLSAQRKEKDKDVVYVLDEADTGISGNASRTVGTYLRNLGKKKQVLCITHLPPVAALADNHLHVDKMHTDGRTEVRIKKLLGKERWEVIDRILAQDINMPEDVKV